MELFHQTVSMKSVGNLNEFVRDHMLEPAMPPSGCASIVAHFEDLTKAHDAVKRAREQLEALAAARRDDRGQVRRRTGARESDWSASATAVRLFIAELRSSLLTDEIARTAKRDGAALWRQQEPPNPHNSSSATSARR